MSDPDEVDSAASGSDDETESNEELHYLGTHHLPFDGESDEDTLQKHKHKFTLDSEYTPEWTRKDAFREFYQNWKDGIVARRLVNPHFFKPEIKETPSKIQITIRADPPPNLPNNLGQLLGYIRFKKTAGRIEMTNFKAKLERKYLNLGRSTKRNDDQLAGCHGEGFKLAALVMIREGHSVKFATNSFYWNFGFSGTYPTLHCSLNAVPSEVLAKRKETYARRVASPRYKRGLTYNVWEDMTVKIGMGRVRGVEGYAVELDEFRDWMTVSFDLDRPREANIVRTGKGDLILDRQYLRRVYLHGLRVDSYGPDGRPYHYGYNFHSGRMNRDRERLANKADEAQTLARIWEEAIDLRGDVIADLYIDLFAGNDELPDVALASKYVSARRAKVIFERLRKLHPDAFLFSDREPSELCATKDEDIIVRDLRSSPFKVDRTLWKVLRIHELVMTPLEQRNHLFATSKPIDPTFDSFSSNIMHALQGSFALNAELRDLSICYVQGGETDIDSLYAEDEKLLRIHHKWLDTEQVHQATNCEFFQASDSDAFFCDHVVQNLLEIALDEVRGPLDILADKAITFRRTAAECHGQMPRVIKISAPDSGNTLMVSWVGNESGYFTENYGATILYRVTLHSTTSCRSRLESVLNDDAVPESCNCPSETVSQAMSKATFRNLDPTQTYFPKVARVNTPSFFGLCPSPIAPKLSTSTQTAQDEDNLWDNDEEAGFIDDSPTNVNVFDSSPSKSRKVGQPPSTNEPEEVVFGRATDENEASAVCLTSAFSVDQIKWREWHEDHMPQAFARLVPRNDDTLLPEGCFTTSECEHLNFVFDTDKYVCVTTRADAMEHVILIHSIFCTDSEPESMRYILSYTKFSPAASVYPFKTQSVVPSSLDCDELVLHFKDVGQMGRPEDGEKIWLEDIVSARDLEVERQDGVEFTTPLRTGTSADAYYCRYAICTLGPDSSAALTPVASHLLQRVHRWKEPTFPPAATPIAFDLTPGILGPAEGLAQAEVVVQTAFEFDREKHVSWKIWHNTSDIYDGTIPEIFDDFDSGKLLPPAWLRQGRPKIVVRASEHNYFRFDERNTGMSTIEEFLRPLGYVVEILETLKPSLLVLLLPPAVLHPDVSEALRSAILSLLQRRLSVHLKLTTTREYGLPQNRSLLTLIASPFCASFSWQEDRPESEMSYESRLEDAIGDLAFLNLRSNESGSTGLVCSPPTLDETEIGAHVKRYIYNHETGKRAAVTTEGVSVSADSVLDLARGSQAWIHPVRNDRLTVREIARVQGLPDELMFYGSLATQYEAVSKAIPPIITRTIAETMLHLIRARSAFHVKVEGSRAGARSLKRARVEDGDEE